MELIVSKHKVGVLLKQDEMQGITSTAEETSVASTVNGS